jgi:hypothetical protein
MRQCTHPARHMTSHSHPIVSTTITRAVVIAAVVVAAAAAVVVEVEVGGAMDGVATSGDLIPGVSSNLST